MYIALPVDRKMSVDGKMEKYRDFYNIGGWQKLTDSHGNAANPIADSSTDFLQNFTLSISSKIQLKSSKIQNPAHQTLYRTTYRQNILKSNISTTSKPKNQTSISPKIYTQI